MMPIGDRSCVAVRSAKTNENVSHTTQEPCYRRENRAMHFAFTKKPTTDCTSPRPMTTLTFICKVSEKIGTENV